MTFSWLNLPLINWRNRNGKISRINEQNCRKCRRKGKYQWFDTLYHKASFQIKNEEKANDEILKNMDGVVTVMRAGGQYQVVIGNHVPVVFEEVIKQETLLLMRLFQQKK